MDNINLFTNVFKSLFGSSITPTASQFVPITAQDGTPAGVSSMANLASVLGGVMPQHVYYENFSEAGNYDRSLDIGCGIFLAEIDGRETNIRILFFRWSNGGHYAKVSTNLVSYSYNIGSLTITESAGGVDSLCHFSMNLPNGGIFNVKKVAWIPAQ